MMAKILTRKSVLMQSIERQFGAPLESLIRLRVERGLNHVEIARELGVNYETFGYWLLRLGARFSTTVTFASEDYRDGVSSD